MSDPMIKYDKAGLADYTHGLTSYSAELDDIAQQAMNILGGISEYFTTDNASVSYAQVQQMINEGIQQGKEVIFRHGDAVNTSSEEFTARDISAGNSFGAI